MRKALGGSGARDGVGQDEEVRDGRVADLQAPRHHRGLRSRRRGRGTELPPPPGSTDSPSRRPPSPTLLPGLGTRSPAPPNSAYSPAGPPPVMDAVGVHPLPPDRCPVIRETWPLLPPLSQPQSPTRQIILPPGVDEGFGLTLTHRRWLRGRGGGVRGVTGEI